MRRQATTRGPLSLRKLSLWLPVATGLALLAGVVLVAMVSLSLIQLADQGGADAAPRRMDELRAVGNLERLVALGDQLVLETDTQRRRSLALGMQALALHPSIAGLGGADGAVRRSFVLVGELLAASETRADEAPGVALTRANALWETHRAALKALADDTAAAMVLETTRVADHISARARLILALTVGGAAIVALGTLYLVGFARRQLILPLLAVSDYLVRLRKGTAPGPLPDAGNREMREVIDASLLLADAQLALEQMALYDRLTGLPNRYGLETRLDQAMAHARRHERRLAVMFVDLDHFKSVNDSLGHGSGDRLLRIVAERLEGCVREMDMLARLGGDEFVVVLGEIASAADAAVVAGKLLEVISQPLRIDAMELRLSASLGICLFPDDGADVTTLMKNADIAMYHAKAAGRANYQFFDRAMNEAASNRLRVESELRRALEAGEFVLHFQPQMSADGRALAGAEALIRWRLPDGRLRPPVEFIPFAEECGLIVPMGEWVLEEACRTLAAWRAEGLLTVRLAVNLSVRQLRDASLPGRVAELLARHRLPPGLLELEITESAAMERPETTIGTLRALKELGVELAIDDFGTGYSSLAYLKLFPIDRLKLDRTFVRDIESDPNDASICAATIHLAHSLGLQLVAEGVENAAQFAYLRELGCDLMQGYFFDRPLPAEEFSRRLRRVAMV